MMEEDNDMDHDMVAYELLQMQNESYWLIKTEVPTVCKRVKRILNKCIDFLKPLELPTTDEEEDKNKTEKDKNPLLNTATGTTTTTTTSTTTKKKEEELEDFEVLSGVEIQEDTNEVLKDSSKRFETLEGSRGVVNLNGWMVDSQEFIIKFLKQSHHHKSNQPIPLYKTSIQKENPWRIQQIQNSYNHLGFIIAELDNIIAFSENFVPPPIYPMSNNNNNNNVNSTTNDTTTTDTITNIDDTTSSQSSQQINLTQSSEYIPTVPAPLSSSQGFIIPTPSNIKAIQNSSVVRSPELISLVENIKSISEWLSMAKEELLLPSRNVFPTTLYLPNVLQPPLPFEINVDISLSNCDLLISIHELQISSVESNPSRFSPNSTNNDSPSKFLRRSSASTASSSSLTQSSSSLPSSQSNTPSKSSPIHSSSHHNNHHHHNNNNNHQQQQQQQHQHQSQNGKTLTVGDNPGSSMGTRNTSNPNLLSLSQGSISNTAVNGSLSPNSSSLNLLDGETLQTPDYMKKPFQTNKGGSLQWINVINHTEARIPMRQLSDSFALLTSAYDKLADLSEKFMVISNIN